MMFVVLLLVFALIPLMNLGGSTHRQAFFTEHHLLAMPRARLVLDLACAIDFELYDALAKKSGGVEATVDLDQICGAGTIQGLYEATVPGTQGYTIKLGNFRHAATFVRLDDATGRIDVDVRWSFAGDSRDRPDHVVRLSRLVYRREAGTNQRYALR
jgi:hypothetical protein